MAFLNDTNFNWVQDGMRDYMNDPSANNFFAHTWDMDQENLAAYDPFVKGYAYIIWTKLPKFFSTEMVKNFKFMTERNFKSFSGLGDMTMESDQVTSGFAGNNYDAATNMKKAEGNFNLTHQEYLGSPIRQLYEYWLEGVRDHETGLATYHGKIASGQLRYSASNHTGELLYIVTDPAGAAGGATSIESASYYTNVFPGKIPQEHLNYSSGDHGLTEIDIDFKGVWHKSRAINQLAKDLISTRIILPSYGDYGDASVNNQKDLAGTATIGRL